VSPRQEKDETGQNVIIGQLEDLMRTRKAFLDPDLSIQQTAQMLSTNRTYLSRAINGILGTSFPQYISDLRIREAIRLIREGFMVKHKQEALATACGFSSRTVFIATFKKHTGVTPSFFIANFEKNDGEGKEEGEG
jgi:AraC-like DNA-binding protein